MFLLSLLPIFLFLRNLLTSTVECNILYDHDIEQLNCTLFIIIIIVIIINLWDYAKVNRKYNGGRELFSLLSDTPNFCTNGLFNIYRGEVFPSFFYY